MTHGPSMTFILQKKYLKNNSSSTISSKTKLEHSETFDSKVLIFDLFNALNMNHM